MKYRTKYCEGCHFNNSLLQCIPKDRLCKEHRDIPEPMNAIMRLLRSVGKKSSEYNIVTYGSRYETKRLSDKEIESTRKMYSWMVEKKIKPITGYIYETRNGSFFINDVGGPWEIVDNKPTS